jgi:hypothetical protein
MATRRVPGPVITPSPPSLPDKADLFNTGRALIKLPNTGAEATDTPNPKFVSAPPKRLLRCPTRHSCQPQRCQGLESCRRRGAAACSVCMHAERRRQAMPVCHTVCLWRALVFLAAGTERAAADLSGSLPPADACAMHVPRPHQLKAAILDSTILDGIR